MITCSEIPDKDYVNLINCAFASERKVEFTLNFVILNLNILKLIYKLYINIKEIMIDAISLYKQLVKQF